MESIYFKLLLEDVRGIYRELTYFDLLRPVGALIWFVLISRSISGIDRRDRVSAVAYSGYISAAAVTLVGVLPELFVEPWGMVGHGIVGTIGLAAGLIRWYWGASKEGFVRGNAIATIKPSASDLGLRASRKKSAS